MKILVACEESQTITKLLRAKGHEAYSCDIQDCRGEHPEWHIKGDAIKEAYSSKYDAMIAHPPCTFMSKAGARWMYPTAGNVCNIRLSKAMDAKEFFLKLMNAPINLIAIENPTPLKIVGLPLHSQSVQPYEYGDPYSKKNLLWLKGLPNLIPTEILKEYKPYLPSNTGGKKRGQSYMFKSISQKESSKTFNGIAKAIANQWF
ncbi:MAG: DNA cytosine methyltransferase [Bacteroidota bacterium]